MTVPKERANGWLYIPMGMLAARGGQIQTHLGKFSIPKECKMVPLNFATVQHPKLASEKKKEENKKGKKKKVVYFPDKLSISFSTVETTAFTVP